jgi:hypothetical protein
MRETNSATSAVASEPKKDLRRARVGSADTAGAVRTSRGAVHTSRGAVHTSRGAVHTSRGAVHTSRGAGMGEALEISRMVRRNSGLAGPGGREETRGPRR